MPTRYKSKEAKLPVGTVLTPLLVLAGAFSGADSGAGIGSVVGEVAGQDQAADALPPTTTAIPPAALAWVAERADSAATGADGADAANAHDADLASARVSASRAALEDERLGLNQSQMAAVAMAMRNPVSVIQVGVCVCVVNACVVHPGYGCALLHML